ncbi:hypothetical protein LJC20_06100 [Eubacteriales bacterium OttesenSCG-928-M02]|nr:hypothetical protein [Eubacteriales bacterium OttesenSCG-928-M02]
MDNNSSVETELVQEQTQAIKEALGETVEMGTEPAQAGQEKGMWWVIQDNIGTYVVVEYLLGQALVRKEGLLQTVGEDYMILFDEVRNTYTVCKMEPTQFVTFYQPGERPQRSGGRGLLR